MDLVLDQIATAWQCGGHTWSQIADSVDLSSEAARSRYRRAGQPDPSGLVSCPICKPKIDTLKFEELGNYGFAESSGSRITTLEGLLAACKVDLSVWKVRDQNGFQIKTWEGYARDIVKDLEFNNGKATGRIQQDGIVRETLYSVQAHLVRIHPEPIYPVLSPIENRPWVPVPEFDPNSVEGNSLVLADTHFGFEVINGSGLRPIHDRLALSLVLKLLAEIQPQIVEFIGDILDLTVWQGKFSLRGNFYNLTQPSLIEAHWFLSAIREILPGSKIRVHCGNHDDRIERSLSNHLREAYELRPADEIELPPVMSMNRLLGLDSLGIEWIGDYPNDWSWLGRFTRVQHGNIARSRGLSTAEAMLRSSEFNQIYGHIHRDELLSRGIYGPDGEYRRSVAYCPGCLCQLDGRVPGSNRGSNWRQGVGFLEWSGPNLTITHIPITNGSAVYRGKLYQGSDYKSELRVKYPEWNW